MSLSKIPGLLIQAQGQTWGLNLKAIFEVNCIYIQTVVCMSALILKNK